MVQVKNLIESTNANVRVYFVKKTRKQRTEHSAIIFPNALNEKIIATYKSNFLNFVSGRALREYDEVHQERETIQFLPASELDEWVRIKSAIGVAEREQLLLNKQDFKDDYSLVVVMIEGLINGKQEQVYFIAKYRKVENWYKKSIRYSFTADTLKEVESEIYVLDGCIDAVICDDAAYILSPANFETIFNHYSKSRELVINSESDVATWDFLDKPQQFYDSIKKSKTAMLKMARVLRKSIQKINNLKPGTVKAVLMAHTEFRDICFDNDDRIIVTKGSRDLIIAILLNEYALDLFTNELVNTKGV